MNNTMYACEKAKSKSVEYSIFKKSISNEPFLVLFTRVWQKFYWNSVDMWF